MLSLLSIEKIEVAELGMYEFEVAPEAQNVHLKWPTSFYHQDHGPGARDSVRFQLALVAMPNYVVID